LEDPKVNAYQEFLDRQDCILLLVDIQKTLLDLCVDPERTVSNAGALIEAAEQFGIPVLFSVHNPDKLGGFLPELTGKISGPRLLGKMEYDCFQNEGIAQAIGATGRKTLLLAGIEGHVCIFHTGAGALRRGYRVHVVQDAVTSRSASDKQVGIHRLDRAGAVISCTEMMIFELLNRAGTEEFRALLPLIKRIQPS
jgi:nicotinamidase-related amidase